MKSIKNIAIITAIYPPEPQISARMSLDLSNYFTSLNHNVFVLCPQPSRMLLNDSYKNLLSINSIINNEDGVNVVRLPSFAAPRSKLLARMWESFSFGRHVTKYIACMQKQPDVLYVNSWPLFSQLLIARYARKHSISFVLQIMDIYPESLTNRLPSIFRFLIDTPLRKIDAWIARSATKVIVISENMRTTYVGNRRISIDSVLSIPTWQDEVIFENFIPRTVGCSKYNIPVKPFTFLFLGNIGPVAGVEFLIRAFAEAEITDAQLLIVGDGSAKLDCVKLAEQLNMSSIYFISDPVAANVPMLQSMAHVCMLPVKRHAGMSSIPSKLPSYLFSAKPVIATVDIGSDTAHFIRQAECGWVGEPEDRIWLATKMKEVSELPREQLERLGQSGKNFGLLHFSKSSGVARLANEILQVADAKV
jgi:glycosyltransferase involved in cell wall biosynthesis